MAAVSRYGPPVALMALIFYLSSRELRLNLDWEFTVRKVGHMAVFGTLFLLWWRALPERTPWIAVVITVAYAISDEYHQTLVEGRSGTVRDVLVDTLGVAVAWLTWTWWLRFQVHRRG